MAVRPLLLVLLLAAVVSAATLALRRVPASDERPVRSARAHARATAGAAVVAAVVLGLAVAVGVPWAIGPATLGIRVLVTVCAAATGYLVAALVGELTWPRPDAPVRRARLARRRLLDAAPRWLARTAAGALGLAALTAAVGTATAAPDGRSVELTWRPGEPGGLGSVAGPYPGSVYAVPALLGLLVVALVALAALRVVADRPAVDTSDDAVEHGLRRASAHRVLRTTAAAALLVGGGLLLTGGQALASAARSVAGSGGAGVGGALVAGWMALGLGLAALLGAVVVLFVPADARPRARLAELA